jgi:hypothetical protein
MKPGPITLCCTPPVMMDFATPYRFFAMPQLSTRAYPLPIWRDFS